MSSDFLFAQPRFLFGLARTLDLGGRFNTYNVSRTPNEADARAMHSDWCMVGQDLDAALRVFGAEHSGLLHPLSRQLPLPLEVAE